MVVPSQIQHLDESLLLLARRTPGPAIPVFVFLSVIGGGWGLLAFLPFVIPEKTRAAALWLLGACGGGWGWGRAACCALILPYTPQSRTLHVGRAGC